MATSEMLGRAVLVAKAASTGACRIEMLAARAPAAGEVRVAVKAAGLNRADLNFRTNHFELLPQPFDRPVLGLELAGTVQDVGSGVPAGWVGRRVMAMCNSACAECNVLPAELLLPTPRHLSDLEASVLPVTYLTAYDALQDRARLAQGETLLVHAASSGVGLAAAQLGRLFGASRIIGTTSNPAKKQALLALGFDEVLVSGDDRFLEAMKDATQGKGADVIVDVIAGDMFLKSLRSLAKRGRYVNVGKFAGMPNAFDLQLVAERRLTVTAASLRLRTSEEMSALVRGFVADVLGNETVARGLKPHIDRAFGIHQCQQGLDYMRENRHIGKVALSFA